MGDLILRKWRNAISPSRRARVRTFLLLLVFPIVVLLVTLIGQLTGTILLIADIGSLVLAQTARCRTMTVSAAA